MSKSINSRILFVLVIYKQTYTDTIAYKALSRNFQNPDRCQNLKLGVYIYDNSPSADIDSQPTISNIAMVYHHDPTNSGVSKAYNSGYRYAEENGYDWLILLDQDTAIADDGLSIYVESIHKYPDALIHAPILKSDKAIISPSKYKFRRGFPLKSVEPGVKDFKSMVPLNSGMCINVKIFKDIAQYNERIRLDFSDFDFIRRVSKKVKNFVLMPLISVHSLSSEDETYESAIVRYRFYCNGAYHSIITKFDSFLFGLVVLLRGSKLAVKFKSYTFLNLFFNYYILKKEI